MSDNTPVFDSNSVVNEIATDELTTLNGVDVSALNPRIKAQRMKPVFGDPHSATDVSATNPLPVTLPNAATVDQGGAPWTFELVDGVTPTQKAAVSAAGALKVDGSGVTQPVSGSVTVSGTVNIGTGPAASRLEDSISSALAGDAIMLGLAAVQPQFAKISASAAGANVVVGPFTGKKIRVLGWNLITNGAVNLKWQTSTGPADLTGLYYFPANGGVSIPFSPIGWFETVAGDSLELNLSTGVAVGGNIVFIQV